MKKMTTMQVVTNLGKGMGRSEGERGGALVGQIKKDAQGTLMGTKCIELEHEYQM